MQRSLEMRPNDASAHYLLGQLYRETGQMDLARQAMERFQKLQR